MYYRPNERTNKIMQIPEYIKIQKSILESLTPGNSETIPPIRELARKYDASLDTVHKALKFLESESFIYKKKRSYKVYDNFTGIKISDYIDRLFSSACEKQKIEKTSIFMTSALTAYYFELADLIILGLQKYGVNTNIFRVPFAFPEEINKEYESVKKSLERNQALIFLPSLSKKCASIITDCRRRQIKTVTFGTYDPMESANNVIVDSYAGSYEAIKYLASLNRIRVGYASGAGKNLPKTSHSYAYRKAASKGFIEDSPELLYIAEFERIRKGMIEYGKLAAEYFLSLKPMPDAILFGDDAAAAAAINVFQEKGVRVPEDISIVGINGSDAAKLSSLQIATVRYPKDKIAEAFIKIIMSPLNWGENKDTITIKSVFDKGNSCSKKIEE